MLSSSTGGLRSSSSGSGGGKSDDATWPEKIDHVLRLHGGAGTSEEICNWIGAAFPHSIEGKINWRRTISARLSVDPGFVKGPSRPGEKGSVWTLLGRHAAATTPTTTLHTRNEENRLSADATHEEKVGKKREKNAKRRKENEMQDEASGEGGVGVVKKRKYSSRTNWNLTSEKIAKAMTDNGGGKGKLCEICDWVQKAYPEDLVGISNWKNRISNYLSNNTLFKKSDDYPAVWSLKEGVSGKGAWVKRIKKPNPGDGVRKRISLKGSKGGLKSSRETTEESIKGEKEEEKEKQNEHEFQEKRRTSTGEREGDGKRAAAIPRERDTRDIADQTWPGKIEIALKKLNGQATAADICDWIEANYPAAIVNKGSWKNVVRASLSNSVKFIPRNRGKLRDGATVWVLAEDVMAGKYSEGETKRLLKHVKKRRRDEEEGHHHGGSDEKEGRTKKKKVKRNTEEARGLKRSREGHHQQQQHKEGEKGEEGEREGKKPKQEEGEHHVADKKPKKESTSPASSSGAKEGWQKKATRHSIGWAEKVEKTLAKNGGVGSLSQIYDWFEVDYPEVVAIKPGWKKLVSAYLSSGQQFHRQSGAGPRGSGLWQLISKLT